MRLRDLHPMHRRRLSDARQSVADLLDTPWAISSEEQLRNRVTEFAKRVESASVAELRQAMDEDEGELPMHVVDGGVAVIRIHGLLIPSGAAFWRWWGFRATDYEEITAAVRAAVQDDSVRSILLDVDSPGGLVRGMTPAVDAVFDARRVKPVLAHTSGLMASAAYHIGSQAQRVSADRNAIVGSIGEIMVLVDASEAAKAHGYEVVVIASGKHKGAGVFGTKITKEHRAAFQELVRDGFESFLADIARARDIDESAADGRVFYAERAMGFGLVDAVEHAPAAIVQAMNARLEDDEDEDATSADPDDEEEPEENTDHERQAGAPEPALEGAQGEGSMPKPKNEEPAGGAQASPPESNTSTSSSATVEELRAQLEEERAKREAAEQRADEIEEEKRLAETVLKATRKSRVTEILDEFQKAGRFDPADRKEMEEAAKPFEEKPEKLRAYLDRILPASRNKEQPTSTVPPEGSKRSEVDPEAAKLAPHFRLTESDLELADNVVRISFQTNEIETRDGKKQPLVQKAKEG